MNWATVASDLARSRSAITIHDWHDDATRWWAWSGPVEPPAESVKAMTPDPSRPAKIVVTEMPAVAVGLDVHWGREELERLKAPAADFPGLGRGRWGRR